MVNPNSVEARDIAYHMHGYTNARTHETQGPMVIERGEGAYVYDNDGNRYLEAMSGLWSTALGFSEPRLMEAALQPDEANSILSQFFIQISWARGRACGTTCKPRTGTDEQGVLHQFGIGGQRYRFENDLVSQQCPRQAGKEEGY